MKLYHGSSEIIKKPVFGKCKAENDYGLGFYCTEHLELAKEWACGENRSGYANAYELEETRLRILNLNSPDFTILNWLAVLVNNRPMQLRTPIQVEGRKQLLERFLPNLDGYDVIRGYRADDSYFSFARAFLGNGISLRQLSIAMQLGNLGEQIVLKSRRAFASLTSAGHEEADWQVYYPLRHRRDRKAREAFDAEASNPDLDGIFMRDILAQRMESNDERLR